MGWMNHKREGRGKIVLLSNETTLYLYTIGLNANQAVQTDCTKIDIYL